MSARHPVPRAVVLLVALLLVAAAMLLAPPSSGGVPIAAAEEECLDPVAAGASARGADARRADPHTERLVDVRTVKAHCRQHLAMYKVPKIVEFTHALPYTATGKVRRLGLV